MAGQSLDDVDRAILHALQGDARRTTADEMAEAAGVSASTIRNRIKKLEGNGVIQGYHPEIDYERAGYQLHVFFVCRAPPTKRGELAEEALGIIGTVTVREMLSGKNNLHIEAIAENSDAVETITGEIDGLGLDIVSTDVVKKEHLQPFDHFGLDSSTDVNGA